MTSPQHHHSNQSMNSSNQSPKVDNNTGKRTWIVISQDPIDGAHWTQAVSDPKAGAVSTFIGMTRQDPYMNEPHHSHQNKDNNTGSTCLSCTHMHTQKDHHAKDVDSKKNLVVIGLEYEAYIPMATKVIQDLIDSIRSRYTSILHVAVVHRLGRVDVQEASILIAISSPHRYDALHGVTTLLDEFKAKVPIWKKEIYSDHETQMWKANVECTGA